MNWITRDDDTITGSFFSVEMEINFMRKNWAWLVTSSEAVPLAGSFLNGIFPKTKEEAKELCLKYAERFLQDQDLYMDQLEERTNEDFEVTLSMNGMQAIIISMLLFEGSRDGIYLEDNNASQSETVKKIQTISMKMLDKWRDFSKEFETSRA